MFQLRDYQPFRLVPNPQGRHQFGGPATHSGTTPEGANEPIHQVLSLDLTDPLLPVESSLKLARLPLYYPFKHGRGGGSIQYAVCSDDEIEILHLPDQLDDPKMQYVQVAELPPANFELCPLNYEEARILGFLSNNGHFQPNREDRAILDSLDTNNLLRIGGLRKSISNDSNVLCHNPDCDFFDRPIRFETLATVPPIPVNGDDEFWYEFQGAYVTFCFVLCCECGTVIAFNLAD